MTRRRPDPAPRIPDPRPADKDRVETAEPYDLPFPDDCWPRRPDDVIVVDPLRGLPGQPPSLAELLERHARIRQPEPDLEAEP